MYGKKLSWLALMAAVVVTAGCGSNEPASQPPAPASQPPAPASQPPAGPRVFFEEPQDGAMVQSPVRLRFGIENFEIAPVPPDTVEKARPGMGHHHVGVDTECLPVGSVVPQAAPWVHFGDGKNEIDMQLPSGSHTLALQIGDDLHTTMTGLCSSINITVTE